MVLLKVLVYIGYCPVMKGNKVRHAFWPINDCANEK